MEVSSGMFDGSVQLKEAFELLPNGIVIVDHNGIINLCNSEFERMFGYENGELRTKFIDMLIPLWRNPGQEIAGKKKTGHKFPIYLGLNPIILEDRKFALASVVDITAPKNIEAQLRKANHDLKVKCEEVEQYVYTISHDLKSPMATSLAFINSLKAGLRTNNTKSVDDALERIERSNRRMCTMIDDLLNLCRAGRLELNFSPTHLKDIVSNVKDNLGELFRQKGFTVEIIDPMPVVNLDASRVQQVFENLLMNAIKYASDVAQPHVKIYCTENPQEHLCCVQDNGPGIKAENHKRIFALFERVSSQPDGTGLGLSIVSRVMEMHHGRAWVESVPDHGASFWLAFPR